jgi:hypothetical protein
MLRNGVGHEDTKNKYSVMGLPENHTIVTEAQPAISFELAGETADVPFSRLRETG